jgi:hypothetical protein
MESNKENCQLFFKTFQISCRRHLKKAKAENHGLRTSRESGFFQKFQTWAWADKLSRKFLGAFGAFSTKLQHPSWHCGYLVHDFEYLIVFSTKLFGFQA